MARTVDRYAVNDGLAALAQGWGVKLDDDTLDELTHRVADAIDARLAKEDGQ